MNYVTGFRIPAAVLAMVLLLPNGYAEDQPEKTAAKSNVGSKQLDRLKLDATSVKGNQELPKVLYIVPWKESGAGSPGGKPVNSLLDEVLAPLDREVFQRQVSYFDQLYETE